MKKEKEEEKNNFLMMSESPKIIFQLSSHLKDISEINQELINKMQLLSHEQKIKIIEESKRPDIYKISVWYQYYWKKREEEILDKHTYLLCFFSLYFTLYFLIILRIWKKEEIVIPKEEVIKRVIPSFSRMNKEIKFIVPIKEDYININENNQIYHSICPVFAICKDKIIHFFYYDDLNKFISFFPISIKIMEKEYSFSFYLINTINNIIKHLTLEEYHDYHSRIYNSIQSKDHLYPIYVIDKTLWNKTISSFSLPFNNSFNEIKLDNHNFNLNSNANDNDDEEIINTKLNKLLI